MSYKYSKVSLPLKPYPVKDNSSYQAIDYLLLKNKKKSVKLYYPPEFYKVRPVIFENFSNKCFLCGNKEADQIHHIDYDTMNNNINNLVLLCFICHPKTNFGRNSWEKFFKNKLSKLFGYSYEKEVE